MFNIKKAILPTPVSVEDMGKKVKIGEVANAACRLTVKGEGIVFEEAVKFLNETFEKKMSTVSPEGDFEIVLTIDAENSDIKGKSEAYTIEITDKKAVLCGGDEVGALYAAYTFDQLLHIENYDALLPQCKIVDYPRFKSRGHYFESRYGSDFMTLSDWKDAIDYLAPTKINQIIIGVYGCWGLQYDGVQVEFLNIPIDKYPELKTPREVKYYSVKKGQTVYKHDALPTMFEQDFLGEVIAYGKKKGIEVIPLFNSLGHNTVIPRVFPETASKDAEGKNQVTCFCTRCDKTYEIMFNIYDEIIDKYLKPNGIKKLHIGLDEVGVSRFCKCEKCRDTAVEELYVEYIINILKHLKKRGLETVYVYHDMWFNFDIVTEEMAQRFKDEGVYDMLVIDWWSYGLPGTNFGKHIDIVNGCFHSREDEVNGIFRSIAKPFTGYFHWSMPTQLNENIYDLTNTAEKNSFEGISAYGTFEHCYDFNYQIVAECAWRGNNAAPYEEMIERYALSKFGEQFPRSVEEIKSALEFSADRYSGTNFCTQIFEYYISSYTTADMTTNMGSAIKVDKFQDFPANRMKTIRDDIEKDNKFLPYFRNTRLKARNAYDFFSNCAPSREREIWKLIALSYVALSDEFLTIYTCNEQYNNAAIDAYDFLGELSRLIKQREEVMHLCENVRIEANQYTAIRDMTVNRQFMLDLKMHIEKEIASGKKPEINTFEFGKYLSEYSKFLR